MSELPLISCIMPTGGKRQRFVRQAVKLFKAQDYPNKELIVIDEHDEDGYVYTAILAQDNIQTISIDADIPLFVGTKRNLGIALSKGDIICQWDDDDWFSPQRLSKQAEPILRDEADITGLTMEYLLHLATWTAWKCTPDLHKEAFAHDTHSGTLMYRKSLWSKEATYPNIRVGEDAQFLRLVMERGARLARIENTGDFIYVRHGDNVWPLLPGKHLHEEGWLSFAPEDVIARDVLAFYASLRQGVRT